jgi:hypothetical protein
MANLIHKSAIPPDVQLEALGAQQQLNTIAGQYSSAYKVPIKDIALPEFDRHRKIDGAYAFVFDISCHYHCILGSGFLTKAGIDIKFSDKQVEWFGNTIPLRCPNDFTPEDLAVCLNSMQLDVDDDLLSDHLNEDIYDNNDNYAVGKILDALYEKMDVAEVVKMQSHLTEQQQSQLLEVLSRYPKVFGNDLGCYPHKQFHIDLQPDAKPVHRPSTSLSCATITRGDLQERTGALGPYWRALSSRQKRMGTAYFHHTQERLPCSMG